MISDYILCDSPYTDFDRCKRHLKNKECGDCRWVNNMIEHSLTTVEPDTTGVQQACSNCGAG